MSGEIVLTPVILAQRELARKNFPNCDFLPGDVPPVGETVMRGPLDAEESCVVLGEYQPPYGDKDSVEPCRGWWMVTTQYPRNDGEPGNMVAFEWPPSLRRVKVSP